ncbi:MAG: aldehyde ferredoxin oxidoreductase family protein [Desulfobacterales bacterium]|nr:aldehyde ferredoxin oxidoreductase family protein [Desulfobacterales bacterium]MCP4159671.1 aldehyde ferredoxin oxidoreductase family protein [Deltaproteobacteria bacterium]
MHGWQGQVLNINLTDRSFKIEPLDKKLAEHFLGGRGLNSKTLFDRIEPGIDPLGPDNILCFAPGVFTATTLGLSGRLHVSTLSPYSGIMGDGNVGGAFAAHMKKAGYDQIIITGKSEKPVYIRIENDEINILDANELWGTSVWETTDKLVAKYGSKLSVASIGQAGENLVRSASTMVDKYSSASRGSGAVWGSKNLKAIVVSGTKKVELFDREKYLELSREDTKYLKKDKVQKEIASVYGSLYGMSNWFPGYRNFEKELGPDDVPEQLRPEAWKKYETKRIGCQSCHIKCKNMYEIPSGKRKGELGEGLEYECVYCLGTNCGIEDPVAILEMENLADAYGVDVIAIGNTIALAKDLYNRGIISDKDTDNLPLEWEDSENQIELIHRTVFREGFGNVVAEGLYNFAKIIGKDAMDYCYHVKGLSRGVYPAGLFSLSHAVASRGADHLRGRSWASGENSPEDVLKDLVAKDLVSDDSVKSITIGEMVTTLADSIGRCKGAVNTWTCALPLVWKAGIWDGLSELLKAATGIDYDSEKIEKVCNRIHAVERAFNVRQGVTIEHDIIPQKPEMKYSEAGKIEREEHFEMVRSFYRSKGYNEETGIPERDILESLDLKDVADTLENDAPYAGWNGPVLWGQDKYPTGGTRS